MSEFEKLQRLTRRREEATDEWRSELRRLYAAGAGGTRVLARHAGVSHATVWEVVREPAS